MLVMALGALFEIQTIPLNSPESTFFLAQGRTAGKAGVYVLSAERLTVYVRDRATALASIDLPGDAAAVDVADVDGDGAGELLVVAGERILCYDLYAQRGAEQARELFRLPTALRPAPAGPYLHVMVVQREDEAALALPREEGLELRSLDGRLLATHRVDDAFRDYTYGSPFNAWAAVPPVLAPPDGLELRIAHIVEFDPSLEGPEQATPSGPVRGRRAARAHMRDAAELGAAHWPWFSLHVDGGRVLYALAGPDYRDTLVRIVPHTAEPGGGQAGTQRRYPGILVPPDETLPDFNADGFADLVLWRVPIPGISVESITRAATGGTWPAHLSVHHYAPDKQRYEGRPAGHIGCRLPIPWLLALSGETPFRNLLLRDLDGDGRTDIAFSTAPTRFAVWLCTEDGFAERADCEPVFPEALTGVAFCADLDAGGRMSIGLETASALYVLRPTQVSGE